MTIALKWISRVLSNFYYVKNIFDLHIFENEMATPLNFFEICTDIHFVSLFFLNDRNITTSLLIIQLKFTVVHYTNLNSSSINKPFLNYGLLNMLFRWGGGSYFLFMFILMKLLSKNNYHFLIQIFKIHFKISILQSIRMSNLGIRKCDTKAKFEKIFFKILLKDVLKI